IRETGDPVYSLLPDPTGTACAATELGEYVEEPARRLRQVRLLQTADGKELRTFRDPSPNVWSIHPHGFTPAGNQLVLDFYPQQVRVAETQSGQEIRRFKPSIFGAALTPDGRLLATIEKGEVRLVDVTTGQTVRRFEVQAEKGAMDCRFAWSADGKTLACVLP